MNDLIEQAETLQNMLLSHATGGNEDDAAYRQLRQVFISDPSLEPLLPRFVRTCRSLYQFWEHIKHKFNTYHERRQYLWDEFRPLMEIIERGGAYPSDEPVTATLREFDAAHVHAVWSKALDRRQTDPEGAITMVRTLLETVCKHILDDLSVPYEDSYDLPKLYKLTAENIQIAPSQHTEQVFKQILGGCTSVIEGLGSLRNRLSDSHGKGKRPTKPSPRHAELAVNLAGTMATYLVATWKSRMQSNA